MGPKAQADPEATNDDVAWGVVTNAGTFTPRWGVSSLAGDPPPGSGPLLKEKTNPSGSL